MPEANVTLPPRSKRIGDFVKEKETDATWAEHLASARREFGAAIVQAGTLRALRLSKGLSQTQLAELIGTSQSHIARMELGRNDPNYNTFLRLATALESEIGDVVRAYGLSKIEADNQG